MSDLLQYTLVMLKPDALERGLSEKFETLIPRFGLKKSAVITVRLTHQQVLTYQKAFSIDDPQRGNAWKEPAINLLTSKPSKIYLLSGDEPIQKGNQLKKYFRQNYMILEKSNPFLSKSVYNLIHSVDDPQDFLLSLSVLAPEWFEEIYKKENDHEN